MSSGLFRIYKIKARIAVETAILTFINRFQRSSRK